MVEKEEQIKLIVSKYPFLEYNKEKDIIFGIIEIDENDSYEIEISQLNRFPNEFPMVKEIGGRIPQKLDRHIYTDTLSCCFTTPARERILLKTHIRTLLHFVDLIVVPFFQNNSFYEINGEYSQGEYSHHLGLLEGYVDILGIENVFRVLDILHLEKEPNFKLRPIDKCYCGSGDKLNTCGKHRKYYRNLQKVGKEQIARDFFAIMYSFKPFIERFNFNKKI